MTNRGSFQVPRAIHDASRKLVVPTETVESSRTDPDAFAAPRGSHTPACAIGARAEQRSKCDCGAGPRPYRARLTQERSEDGKHLVELETDGPLSTQELGLFALQLLELCRVEGERWAKEQGRKAR